MSRSHWKRARAAIASAIVICAGVTCTDATGPRSGRASLGIAPVFSDRAAAIYSNVVAAGLEIDNVHLVLNHADGTPAADTIVAIPAGADSIIVEILVDLNGSTETLKAKIDLRDGTIVLFSGNQDVFAVSGGLPQTPPPPVPVEYAGPGATVTSIDVDPADSSIVSPDSIAYRPSAKDQNGANVADFGLLWSVKDPTLGTVNPSGVFKPTGVRGETYVIARTLTGIKDSAHVSIAPPMTKVVLISGGAQTGPVLAALAQPIVVEAQAADNLPVANAMLTVGVTGGGGSVAPSGTVMAGSNGRASLAFTLGSLVGAQTLQVSATGITPLSVTATGIAATPASLIAASPIAFIDSIQGIVAPENLMAVKVKDAQGNGVPNIAVKFRRHGGAGALMNGLPDTVATVISGSDGIAKLTSRKLQDSVGVDSVLATAAGLPDTIRFLAVVANGAPHHLVIDGQPSDAPVLTPIPVVVTVRDRLDNVAAILPGTPPNVTLAIKSSTGTAGAVLGGVLTQPAPGIATFAVTVDKVGTGYVLTATLTGLPVVESTPFAIALGGAAQLEIVSGDSVGVLRGNELVPMVRVRDAANNDLSGVPVTFTLTSGGGELSDGNQVITAMTNASGIATTDWHVGTSGAQAVTATTNGLSVVIHAILAEKLVLVQAPEASPHSGIPMTPQPKVQLQDAGGHPARLAGVSVGAIMVGNFEIPPELSGTTPVITNANGEAVFTDLALSGNITLLGLGPKLGFGATSVDSVYSGNLAMQAGAAATITNQDGDNLQFESATAPQLLRARVRDNWSNSVAGQEVSFSVTQGLCSFSGNSTVSGTSNSTGIAAASTTLSGPMKSCTIRAQLVFPPPECPGGGCEVVSPPSVYQHVFVVPDASGFYIWTGAVDENWYNAANWFDNAVPTGTTDIFVPAANGATNGSQRHATIFSGDESGDARAVIIETGAHIYLEGGGTELYVKDSLAADGSIESIGGTGTVQLGTVTTGVRGTVHALLEVGTPLCSSGNQYVVSGTLYADELRIYCRLMVLGDTSITVGGNLRVFSSGGQLDQARGTITVGGDATFNGYESLTGGLLDIKGNFSLLTNCENQNWVDSGNHTTRMSGDASAAALHFQMENFSCAATFENLEFAASGSEGVALGFVDVGTPIFAKTLRVKTGSVLTIEASATLSILLNGTTDVETGALLTLAGVFNAGTCDSGLVAGDNHGPIHCTVLPVVAAPTGKVIKR